jgi:hypothetical protein
VLASTVVLSLHAWLALQAPAAATDTTAGDPHDQAVLWFRSTDAIDAPVIDARALLDAVAVYTRDLASRCRPRRSAPVRRTRRRRARRRDALRAQGARLGFWCELRPARTSPC